MQTVKVESPLKLWEKFSTSLVKRTFDLIGVAEDELATAWPKKKGEPAGVFALLVPPPGMVDFIPALYRAHARQTCWRVKRKLATQPATDAEVLMHLSRASLRAPLARPFDEIFHWCAARCGFELDEPEWSEDNVKELSLAAVEELDKARKQLRDDERKLP